VFAEEFSDGVAGNGFWAGEREVSRLCESITGAGSNAREAALKEVAVIHGG